MCLSLLGSLHLSSFVLSGSSITVVVHNLTLVVYSLTWLGQFYMGLRRVCRISKILTLRFLGMRGTWSPGVRGMISFCVVGSWISSTYDLSRSEMLRRGVKASIYKYHVIVKDLGYSSILPTVVLSAFFL